MNKCKHGQLARSCNVCELECEVARLREERDDCLAIIKETIDCFAPCEQCTQDPQYQDMVDHLGGHIGFGALMSAASWGWRQRLDVKGGEFVAGPCRTTLENILRRSRAAIDEAKDGE